MATELAALPARPRLLLAALQGIPGWIALTVIAAAVLAIGSIHPPPSAASARISHLDSIIKCPSCNDLSIAESNASTAVALRALVARDVRAGETDAQILSFVEARYGSSVLLSPTDRLVWVIPIAAVSASAAALLVVLWRKRRPRGPVASVSREDDERLVAAALAGGGSRGAPEG